MTALLLSLKTLRREATDHAIAEGLDGGIEELAQAVQELGGGDLSRGSGLRRLADRVSALAGRSRSRALRETAPGFEQRFRCASVEPKGF